MNIGDILLSKCVSNDDVKHALTNVIDSNELIVINDLEECISIPKGSRWVVLYRNETSDRYPYRISPDGVFIDHSLRFIIAKNFNFRIAWSGKDNDPNPYKWYTVYPDGVEKTEYITDDDIE